MRFTYTHDGCVFGNSECVEFVTEQGANSYDFRVAIPLFGNGCVLYVLTIHSIAFGIKIRLGNLVSRAIKM